MHTQTCTLRHTLLWGSWPLPAASRVLKEEPVSCPVFSISSPITHWHHSSTSKKAAFDANHQYAFHPAPLSPQHSSSVSSLHSNCLQSQLAQIICDRAGGKNPVLVRWGVLEVRCISSHFLQALSGFYLYKYAISITRVNLPTLISKCGVGGVSVSALLEE